MASSSSTTFQAPASLPAAVHLGAAFRRLALAVAFGALATAVWLAGSRLDETAKSVALADQPVYLPRAEYLRPMSLGWQNVLADILWFRTISYFGEHYRSDRTYPWLAEMCDLVTDLDPRAEHVYRFAGFILPWEANQADAGIALLEKGARQFPDSWKFQYFLGFQAYFFQNDYAKALTHLRRAAQLPGVHPSVAQLIAVLAAEQYGADTTLEFLAELERSVDSPDLRAVLREKVQEAQLAAALESVGKAVAVYQEQFGHTPLTTEELVDVHLLTAVPKDPFGGYFVIDPLTGAIRSSTGRQPSRLHQSQVREKAMRGEPLHEQ